MDRPATQIARAEISGQWSASSASASATARRPVCSAQSSNSRSVCPATGVGQEAGTTVTTSRSCPADRARVAANSTPDRSSWRVGKPTRSVMSDLAPDGRRR